MSVGTEANSVYRIEMNLSVQVGCMRDDCDVPTY